MDYHKFLLLNQTYALGNVRPELFFVYSCWSFLSVLLLFFTTDIHAFIYFTLFLRGLISRTHTNVYMSFTEWECFCFSSFVEYNFTIQYRRTCVLEYLHRKSISGALICNTASSGIFLHVFWECSVVMDLWTHVDLVLSSSLRTDCFADTSVCLLEA